MSAAWKLFYEQGYDQTTIEDIVQEAESSKGSFYHYFRTKEDLPGTLAMLFDEKYEELKDQMPEGMNAADKLIFLDQELLKMIDDSVSIDLLSRLFSSQLRTHGEKQLLDRGRTYFKLTQQIIREGQAKGELRTDMTANEIVNAYAMFERALLYDWCLCNGEYALARHAQQMMPMFLEGFRAGERHTQK